MRETVWCSESDVVADFVKEDTLRMAGSAAPAPSLRGSITGTFDQASFDTAVASRTAAFHPRTWCRAPTREPWWFDAKTVGTTALFATTYEPLQ